MGISPTKLQLARVLFRRSISQTLPRNQARSLVIEKAKRLIAAGEEDCERLNFLVNGDPDFPDLNRLFTDCVWDADAQRWERKQ
jgi:hypothetical protein